MNNETGNSASLLSRTAIDPAVYFGKPTVRGHCVWVSLILHLLADGLSVADVLDEYPGPEEVDVLACIAYGAELARGGFLDLRSDTA